MQLPPARPRRARQGGRPRRRRHAAGVQHRRHLRRDHDGHPGDEGLAGQPRGDSRLDRADGPRLPVRRDRRPLRLRQDDPRLRDGAGPARRPLGGPLRRLDRPRPLAWPRRHDPRRLRGDRRPQRRRHERRGTERARGRRKPRRRGLRWPVHRQHDGLRLRGAGDQRRRLGDGAGRRRGQGHGRGEDRGAGHQRPRRRHHAEQGHHPRLARELDRLCLRLGRLDQRGPAPDRPRPRARDRADDGRLRAHLPGDAAVRRPEAGGRFVATDSTPPAACRWSSGAWPKRASCTRTRSRSPARRSARSRRKRPRRRAGSGPPARRPAEARRRPGDPRRQPRPGRGRGQVAGTERTQQTGPARVFESEEECFRAVKDQKINAGDVS